MNELNDLFRSMLKYDFQQLLQCDNPRATFPDYLEWVDSLTDAERESIMEDAHTKA